MILEILPPANTTQNLSRYMLDLGDAGRWSYFSLQATLFYFLVFLTLYSLFENDSEKRSWSMISALQKVVVSKWTFIFFILAFILFSRIPLAIYGFQNPDESLWIAMAKTLIHDPRYWVSVDGGTGGPLVAFSLISLKIVGLPIDFGTLKIMTATLMAISLSFLFLTFTMEFGSLLGRLLILTFVVAVAVMKNNDMIAYNSEHLVIILISIAFYFIARLKNLGPGRLYFNIIAIGLFLGAVPLAKLQGAPMAFLIGLFACLIIYTSRVKKLLIILIGSALLPTLFTLLIVLSYSGFNDFWFSYISNNLLYASQNNVGGFKESMKLLIHLLYEPRELNYFLNYSSVVI